MSLISMMHGGIDTGHQPGHTVDRPGGRDDVLLLRFRTPMEVRCADGATEAHVDDALIYAPGQAQWYRGRGVPFRDDWLHLSGPEVMTAFARYDIPVGRVFHLQDPDVLARGIHDLLTIRLRRARWWEEELDLAARRLLVELGRAAVAPAGPSIPRLAELARLRADLHADLTRAWRVADMAAEVRLGPSRFTELYRRAFGTSPLDDLITARIQRARWLLATTTMSLADIAAEAGFTSEYYLIRQFRARIGMTPGTFRRRGRS